MTAGELESLLALSVSANALLILLLWWVNEHRKIRTEYARQLRRSCIRWEKLSRKYARGEFSFQAEEACAEARSAPVGRGTKICPRCERIPLLCECEQPLAGAAKRKGTPSK